MIEVIFKIFLTDYIDFQGFITKRIQKPLLIEYITVSCAEGDEGHVYDGKLEWEEKTIDFQQIPATRTQPMFILADPDRAFQLSRYPNQGVGLLRMEFIITNSIRVHPMALVKFHELTDSNDKKAIEAITSHYKDKKKYFVEKLSEAVAMVAAAFLSQRCNCAHERF
jgi:pyruvate,water dikinase